MCTFTLILVGGMVLLNKYWRIEIIDRYPYLFAVFFLVISNLAATWLVRKKNS